MCSILVYNIEVVHCMFYISIFLLFQSSPYEFTQRWSSVSSHNNSTREYAELLEQIPPTKLPEVITSKLEGTMLNNILAAISKEFIPQSKGYTCCLTFISHSSDLNVQSSTSYLWTFLKTYQRFLVSKLLQCF